MNNKKVIKRMSIILCVLVVVLVAIMIRKTDEDISAEINNEKKETINTDDSKDESSLDTDNSWLDDVIEENVNNKKDDDVKNDNNESHQNLETGELKQDDNNETEDIPEADCDESKGIFLPDDEL